MTSDSLRTAADEGARPMSSRGPILTDFALAQRLERTEGKSNAAFVEARARISPDVGAMWRDIAGTYVMFDGVGSPCTQTFALGLFSSASAEVLETIEAFYRERGSDVLHEVCPLTDPSLIGVLTSRGYRPVEHSNVLFQPITSSADVSPPSGELRARRIAAGEERLWAETSAGGWGETPDLAAFVQGFGEVAASSSGSQCYLAELDGEPVAAASMAVHDGVALLAGASTIPAWRKRGAQGGLLAIRLRDAAALGCTLAMMGALPGSSSQLNAERHGFRIAYTRTKWGLTSRSTP